MLTLRDYQRAAVDAVTPDEHRALLVLAFMRNIGVSRDTVAA